MTVDQVINGLDCCSKLGNLYCGLCPYYGKPFCSSADSQKGMGGWWMLTQISLA